MAGALGALGWNLWQRQRALDFYRGKTVLITGGSRGLGLCLGRELVQAGARVAICSRHQAELQGAARELQAFHRVCDVSVPEQVDDLVARVRANLGPIDVLVNNAGIIMVGPLQDMTLQQFRACMDTNFWGMVHPTLAVLGEVQAVLNVTSIGGRVTVPHLLPYCCAKAATVAFSEGLRMEMPHLKVLTAVPGLMRTGSYDNALFRGQQALEYGWFSLSSSLPGITMDAPRAARQLLRALARGRNEHRVTLAAELLARGHGLLPELFNDAMRIFTTLVMPGPDGSPTTVPGAQLANEMPSWHDRLMVLGKQAKAEHQLHRSDPAAEPGGHDGRRDEPGQRGDESVATAAGDHDGAPLP